MTILPENIGTNQCSKLDPKFFDIYTNDMNSLFENDESVMYADDTTEVYVGEDLSVLDSHVNSVLAKFLDWCRFNKMALNPNKCEYMLLTNKCVAHEPSILLGGEPITGTGNFKYLGIMLDDKLKFNTQIEYVKSRLSQFCGISYRLKRYFTLDVAKNFITHVFIL